MSRTFDSQTDVGMDREDFAMQRAYLYGLTIRADIPDEVKVLIKNIEIKLSDLAEVQSHFETEE